MMKPPVEWPIRRRSPQKKSTEIAPDLSFRDVTAAAFQKEDELQNLVQKITKALDAASDPTDFRARLNELLWPSGHTEQPALFASSNDLIVAIAFASAFLTIPTVNTWNYLWSLARDTELEFVFPRVVTAIAKEYQSFKSLFIEIASKIVKEAVAEPGRSLSQRNRVEYSQLREDWKQNHNLTTIWSGLRGGDCLFFRDDYGILGIVTDLDLEVFMGLLSEFDNPYPILAALQAAGTGWSFSRWQTMFLRAPVAFDDNSNWNGSPIVPLLLVIARDQVLDAQSGMRAHGSDEAIQVCTAEINELAKEIAKIVEERSDSVPCAQRWATWLMRQTVIETAKKPTSSLDDPHSHGYTDLALINELGAELSSSAWVPSLGSAVESWEPWCYRCVLVKIALNGNSRMPSATDFLNDWALSSDDWARVKGWTLRERASIFVTFGTRPDANGTWLLAIPLVNGDEPQMVWRKMWDAAQTIREIVEFGDPDATEGSGTRMEIEAPELMELLFGIGLMMLECLVDPDCKVQSDRKTSLEALFGLLFDAVKEMSTIDIYKRIYWNEAFCHLAIRRAVWVGDAKELAAVFGEQSKPTLGDFLTDFSGEPEELIRFLDVLLRNHVGGEILRQTLIESDIDLKYNIDFVLRLIDADPKWAAISKDQLLATQSLLISETVTV